MLQVSHYQWLIDDSPGADIPSRDMVGMASVSTTDALKHSLGLPIALVDDAALRALPRCIAWIDENNGNAKPFGLVRDEAPQLMEAPIGQSRTLAATSLNPLSYARKVFESNSLSVAFCRLYDCLRDAMVYILLVPRLFATCVHTSNAGSAANRVCTWD
jgi:hypothetical protein